MAKNIQIKLKTGKSSKGRSLKMLRALEHIKKIRPKPFKGKIDYEELINCGRDHWINEQLGYVWPAEK